MFHEEREIVGEDGTISGLVTILYDDEDAVHCDCCRKNVLGVLLTFDGSGEGLGDEICMCADCFESLSTRVTKEKTTVVDIESHPRVSRKTLIIHGAHACDVCKTIERRVFSFDASGQVYDPLNVCGSCLQNMYTQVMLQKLSL